MVLRMGHKLYEKASGRQSADWSGCQGLAGTYLQLSLLLRLGVCCIQSYNFFSFIVNMTLNLVNNYVCELLI